ncbi:MAG TPA: nitroreductase family protein [Methanomassiliicoccales archaeon]|jgi:nitroreductase
MNEVLKNIYARRSVRSYSEKKVPEDTIKEILRTGASAPNGMGVQPLRFVVIENQERIDHYSGIAKELFKAGVTKNRPKDEPLPENLQGLVRTLSNPDFHLFYHAPVTVFVFAHPSALTPVEDASTAVENMFLYARSLGIGSCWIGFAGSLAHSQEFLQECQAPSDHKLVAQFVLGYPKGDFPEAKQHEPQIIGWIK